MNKMPITPASGPSPVPQISGALQTVYSDIVHPLFFPPPSEFIQPLLDSFVESQDALLEDNTVFTASMRLREAAVECDGTIRELRRRDNAPKEAEAEAEHLSLDAVRKQRLRARLESVLISHLKRCVSRLTRFSV